MIFDVLSMLLGQFAGSLSLIFIRDSQLSPGMLAAYRLFFISMLLLPVHLRDRREVAKQTGLSGGKLWGHLLRHSVFAGLMLGFHFVFWNSAARMTLAANATLFVSMTPIAMPFVVYAIDKTAFSWKEAGATALALSGAVLLSIGDVSIGKDHLKGDIFSLVAMLFLTIYLALSRRNKNLPFWYYIWGVYLIGGVTAFVADLLSGNPIWSQRGARELIGIVGLALVSTLIGHNLINRAMRRIPSQIVSVGQLTQSIWAGLIGWIGYSEVPSPFFYPSMGLITLGTIFMIVIHRKKTIQKE